LVHISSLLKIIQILNNFSATVCKTVRPMLSYRSGVLSVYVCLSVTLVLWPNGWTDEDKTWRAGMHRPCPHCVRWGPSSPLPKGHIPLQFLVHICCGQMAGRIKMPLGMDVDLGPGDFVLDGDPKGAQPHPIFGPYLLRPNGCMDQDVTWYRARSLPRQLCVRWRPRSIHPKKGHRPPPNFRPISIVAKRLHASRCHLVWR